MNVLGCLICLLGLFISNTYALGVNEYGNKPGEKEIITFVDDSNTNEAYKGQAQSGALASRAYAKNDGRVWALQEGRTAPCDVQELRVLWHPPGGGCTRSIR